MHYSLMSSRLLLLLRIIASFYLTGFYIYDFYESEALMERFLYLTYIGYYLTWLYFILTVQSRFIRFVKGLSQYCEVLFQTAFCLEVFITIAFWGILYTFGAGEQKSSLLKQINWHGVPMFFLLLDFIFCSYRFILKQFTSVLILIFIYLICINLPYSLSVQSVYKQATDWVGWKTYVFIAAGIIIMGVSFGIGRCVFVKCKKQKIQRENVLKAGDDKGRQGAGESNCKIKNSNMIDLNHVSQ